MRAPAQDTVYPTPGLQLRLMGVPEVRLNGVPVTFSRRRALGILVYLAVTGHTNSRDVLATLFSGEAPESQARKRLSNALAEIRQRVGEYVVTTRDTAAFNTALPAWTDVGAFRTAVARGMEAEGLEPLRSSLDLFQEGFLSGLAVGEAPGFDEWVMLQGEALRTQAVQGLQELVARAVRTGADVEGIVAARQLISLEPWLEEAHRHLMILLSRVGQRQEALAQYEQCRSILFEDLGEEPTPETTELYDRLRAHQLSVAGSRTEVGQSIRDTPQSKFSQESAGLLGDVAGALSTALQQAESADPGLLVLLGRLLVEQGMALIQLSQNDAKDSEQSVIAEIGLTKRARSLQARAG